MTNGWFG